MRRSGHSFLSAQSRVAHRQTTSIVYDPHAGAGGLHGTGPSNWQVMELKLHTGRRKAPLTLSISCWFSSRAAWRLSTLLSFIFDIIPPWIFLIRQSSAFEQRATMMILAAQALECQQAGLRISVRGPGLRF